MTNKETLLYPPSMEEYWKVGDPNHEKPPILEIDPSPHNPMWILVNHLASDPNASLVSIRNGGSNGNNGFDSKHVTVWVLPKGLGVINNVWGDEEFVSIMKRYGGLDSRPYPFSNGLNREVHGQSNSSNVLTPYQIRERVVNIANQALHSGNGKHD